MVVIVIIIIIIMDPQWSWSQTVTEGRPTPCLCQLSGALGLGRPGDREERACPDGKARPDEQTVPSNALISMIILIRDIKGRKLRPTEGKNGLPRATCTQGHTRDSKSSAFSSGGWMTFGYPLPAAAWGETSEKHSWSPSRPSTAFTVLEKATLERPPELGGRQATAPPGSWPGDQG